MMIKTEELQDKISTIISKFNTNYIDNLDNFKYSSHICPLKGLGINIVVSSDGLNMVNFIHDIAFNVKQEDGKYYLDPEYPKENIEDYLERFVNAEKQLFDVIESLKIS